MSDKENKDDTYEYVAIPLIGMSSKYISVPASIIIDGELDTKRISIFSYLRIHCGLNDIVHLTIPDMVTWCGNKPEKGAKGINSKFLDVMDILNDRGYLTYLTEPDRTAYMKCRFNMDYFQEECTNNGFALLYLDEIEKIMKYKKENAKDGFLTNSVILLVFAYLRYKINRRPNKLRPEERNTEGIANRKSVFPDAYADSLLNISDELRISSKTLSKIIDILECHLGLIVTDRAYRTKNDNDEYRTPYTIFANAYKREGKYHLDVEDDYSRIETENKSRQLKKIYGDYTINKEIRKGK